MRGQGMTTTGLQKNFIDLKCESKYLTYLLMVKYNLSLFAGYWMEWCQPAVWSYIFIEFYLI